jgi:hypothetical protein
MQAVADEIRRREFRPKERLAEPFNSRRGNGSRGKSG